MSLGGGGKSARFARASECRLSVRVHVRVRVCLPVLAQGCVWVLIRGGGTGWLCVPHGLLPLPSRCRAIWQSGERTQVWEGGTSPHCRSREECLHRSLTLTLGPFPHL